ncbi:MAG: ABC transporter ATP-binding protein [Victivallaceae bacterium]|nr:ABC transporter ATP-binding protein [Victivallaceae bacterium]
MNIIFDLIKVKKKEFIAMAILATLGAVLAIVPYMLIYSIINEFINMGMNVDIELIFQFILLALAAIFVRYFFVVFSFVFSHIAAFDLLYLIRTRITSHLGKLPMGFWSDNSSGRVRKTIHEDVERIENFVAHHIPDVIAGTVLPLCTITVLFFIDWRLALAALVPLPIGFLMIKIMYSGVAAGGRNRKQLWRKYHETIEAMHSTIVEYVQGMPVVKAFNISVESFRRLQDAVLGYRHFTVMLSKSQTPFFVIFVAMVIGGGIFILPVAYHLLRTGQTDIATILLFLILGTGCFSEFAKVMLIAGHCEMIFAAGERIGSILQEKELPEPVFPALPKKYESEFKNVSFQYNSGSQQVLKNISVKFPESSFTAIVGASGSGKTTLVHLIARMWDIEEGSISIGGENIKSVGTAGLNQMVGMVFQDVQMLTDTVRANICMNKTGVSQREIEQAAETAFCHDFIVSLPRGYDTVIGEGGEVHLSGGEKQRIAIARAVLKNPPVILLDEASCYTDAENEINIQKAFSRVMKNKTVIVIAHRLSTIVHADNILVMDKGEIAEHGRHGELLMKNGIYKKMWEAHSKAKGWKLSEMEVG